MTEQQILELAKKCSDRCASLAYRDETHEQSIAAVLREVLPPPAGSVKVRIAVTRSLCKDGKVIVQTYGIDEIDDESAAVASVHMDDDTHRGIVEAFLPPVQPVPVVEGRAV